MTGYRFLPEARDDLASAVAHYDREFPGLGQNLAREAQRVCSQVDGAQFSTE